MNNEVHNDASRSGLAPGAQQLAATVDALSASDLTELLLADQDNRKALRSAVSTMPDALSCTAVAEISAYLDIFTPSELPKRGHTRNALAGAKAVLCSPLRLDERLLLDDVVPSPPEGLLTQNLLLSDAAPVLKAVVAVCNAGALMFSHGPVTELVRPGLTVAETIVEHVARVEDTAARSGIPLTSTAGALYARHCFLRVTILAGIFAQAPLAAGELSSDECVWEYHSWQPTELFRSYASFYAAFQQGEFATWLPFALLALSFAIVCFAEICEVGNTFVDLMYATLAVPVGFLRTIVQFAWSRAKLAPRRFSFAALVAAGLVWLILRDWPSIESWAALRAAVATAAVCLLGFAGIVYQLLGLLGRVSSLARGCLSFIIRRTRQFVASAHGTSPTAGAYQPGISAAIVRGFPVSEMAMNGSEFVSTTHSSNLVAMLKWSDVDGVYCHKGFAFRYRDYLVTAYHVLDALDKEPGGNFLAPVKLKNKTRLEVDMSKCVEVEDFDNIVPSIKPGFSESWGWDNDVAICKFRPDFFSKMGLKSVAFTTASYDAPVSTFGYFPPEVKRANGQVLKSDPSPKIRYSSSTRDGSSGSPVVVGSKVLAMHQGHDGKINFGLATAVIELLVDLHERNHRESTNNVFEDKVRGVYRDSRGREVEVTESDFGLTMTDARGRVFAIARDDVRDFGAYMATKFDDDLGYRFESASRLPVAPIDTTLAGDGLGRGSNVQYNDDCVLPPDALKPPTPRRTDTLDLTGLPLKECKDMEKPVHTPTFKGLNKIVSDAIDYVEAKRLGFVDGVYSFPSAKGGRAEVLRAFQQQVNKLKGSFARGKAPSDEVRAAAMVFVSDSLKAACFQMTRDPLSDENITSVLNSSLIKGTKSPGRFFIGQGLTTNEAVLDKYSNKEVCQMVRALGSEPADINIFPKIDPQKRTKLASNGPRLISGIDVRETIRTNCFFAKLNASMAANYRKTGIAVGWSPIKVGDADWLVNSWFGGRKNFLMSDVMTFDWTYLKWFINDVADVIVSLAKPARGMSEEEAQCWREQARETIIRQFTMPLVLPDGTRVLRLDPAIMSSGSVLTLVFNSITMKYLDSCAKIEMGYTLDLLKLFKTFFGGDDGMQSTPADFDSAEYKRTLEGYGLLLHDFETKPTIDGCTFFSWLFQVSKTGVKFLPSRFTKHVEQLRATPSKDLADALISHMTNWVHSEEHFRFFEQLYLGFGELTGLPFPLSYPSRKDILVRLSGLEFGRC